MITGKAHVYFPICVKHWLKHCLSRKVLNRSCLVRPGASATLPHLWPCACCSTTQMLGDTAKVPAQLPSAGKNTQVQRGAQLSLEIAAVPSKCWRWCTKGSKKAAHVPFVFTLSLLSCEALFNRTDSRTYMAQLFWPVLSINCTLFIRHLSYQREKVPVAS